MFNCLLDFFYLKLWVLQTILLCIVEELAGGGFMDVAVGVGDMSQVTPDM